MLGVFVTPDGKLYSDGSVKPNINSLADLSLPQIMNIFHETRDHIKLALANIKKEDIVD